MVLTCTSHSHYKLQYSEELRNKRPHDHKLFIIKTGTAAKSLQRSTEAQGQSVTCPAETLPTHPQAPRPLAKYYDH